MQLYNYQNISFELFVKIFLYFTMKIFVVQRTLVFLFTNECSELLTMRNIKSLFSHQLSRQRCAHQWPVCLP